MIISAVGTAMVPLNSMLGNIVIERMVPYDAFGLTIWGLEAGPVHKFFTMWMFITALVLMFVLVYKLRKGEMELVKKQIKISLAGFAIMFAIIVATSFVPIILLDIVFYPLNTLAFAIFDSFVLYTILKYRMFLVAPTMEAKAASARLPKSGIYEMKREEGYEKFSIFAKSGLSCLGFISTEPSVFREKYGLKTTPLFLLTENPGKDSLNPNIPMHREMIVFIITSLLEQISESAILLDLCWNGISEEAKNKIIENIQEITKEYGGVFMITKC